MSERRKRRASSVESAVAQAKRDAFQAGYATAIIDLEGAIYAGDVMRVIRSAKRQLEIDDGLEPLCLTLETRIGLGQ